MKLEFRFITSHCHKNMACHLEKLNGQWIGTRATNLKMVMTSLLMANNLYLGCMSNSKLPSTIDKKVLICVIEPSKCTKLPLDLQLQAM